MSRTLTLLFRRDPSRDRQTDKIHFEGYVVHWPDGKTVDISLDAFCKHGQRLLGLGKHLAGCAEKLVKLVCLPISGRDDDLNRIPGFRVRRFYIVRTGTTGRLHFMDGTPTATVFEVGRDDARIIHWIGLNTLNDGETQWCDIAAVEADTAVVPHRRFRRSEIGTMPLAAS
ncbi:MAG: hypothetical protein HY289_10405 [Planctomycetes bacterium]|nr:hypothetical protein [Planctomycetota bacterium]